MTTRRKCSISRLVISSILLAGSVMAGKPAAPKLLTEKHPFLVNGALTHAQVATLPADLIVRTQGLEVKADDLAEAIAKAPLALGKDFERDPFPMIERLVAYRLMLSLARKQTNDGSQTEKMSEQRLLQKYLDRLTQDVKPSEADVKEFYEQNRAALGNQPLEKIKDYVAAVVNEELRAKRIDQFVRDLGSKQLIEVSAAWVEKHAAAALDNPIDRLRGKGKPVLAVFSGASCCGPDTIKPVLDAVRKAAGDKAEIVYLEARSNQALALRHRISGIPTSIVFDANGRETTRHQGAAETSTILGWLGLDDVPAQNHP